MNRTTERPCIRKHWNTPGPQEFARFRRVA